MRSLFRLARLPGGQRSRGRVACAAQDFIVTGSLRGQFDDIAVRVAEIDRVNDAMVRDAAGLDAGRLAPGEHRLEVARTDLERDMEVVVVLRLEVERHVRRLEEGDAGAVVHSIEGMKGAGVPARLGLSDFQRRDERQAEEVLVEFPGLLGIATAIGGVVQSLDHIRSSPIDISRTAYISRQCRQHRSRRPSARRNLATRARHEPPQLRRRDWRRLKS